MHIDFILTKTGKILHTHTQKPFKYLISPLHRCNSTNTLHLWLPDLGGSSKRKRMDGVPYLSLPFDVIIFRLWWATAGK